MQFSSKNPPSFAKLFLLAVILLGIFIRALPVFQNQFPLNDGGLFFAMTRDLIANNFVLPVFTSYNQAAIPFCYPPLAFYLGAASEQFFSIPLLSFFRFAPLVASIGTFITVGVLAYHFHRSVRFATCCLAVFAVLPRSFEWYIMGGGVSRSFGFLFSLLTLVFFKRVLVTHRMTDLLWVTLFGAATLTSHGEAALFLAISAGVVLFSEKLTIKSFINGILSGVGILILSSPWWVAVLSRHGLSPFQNAKSTVDSLFYAAGSFERIFIGLYGSISLTYTQQFFGVLGGLAFIGWLTCLYLRKDGFWIWWLIVPLVDYRAGAGYATVPLALMVGSAAEWALSFNSLSLYQTELTSKSNALPKLFGVWRIRIATFVVAVYLTASATIGGWAVHTEERASLQPGELEAIEWIRANVKHEASFIVLETGHWALARTAEWLPALVPVRSLTTVQGSEWLPARSFIEQFQAFQMAQSCRAGYPECLDILAERFGNYDYVIIPASRAGSYSKLSQS